MPPNSHSILFPVFISALQSIAFGQECGSGTVGRIIQAFSGTHDAQNAFYLNRGDPATCSGMITSVNYCLRGVSRTSSADAEYLGSFATYRLNDDINTYTAVSSAITLRVTEQHLRSVLGNKNSFGCSTFTLDQPLPIETGEVLGVCIFDQTDGNSIQSLNLVGAPNQDNEGDLWRIRPAPDCTETTVPESVTGNDAVSTRAVYLYANIGICTSLYIITCIAIVCSSYILLILVIIFFSKCIP